MNKLRVHDLAGEFGITSDEVINLLRQMDVPVRSHLSPLSDDQIARIRARWEREKRARCRATRCRTAPSRHFRRGSTASRGEGRALRRGRSCSPSPACCARSGRRSDRGCSVTGTRRSAAISRSGSVGSGSCRGCYRSGFDARPPASSVSGTGATRRIARSDVTAFTSWDRSW